MSAAATPQRLSVGFFASPDPGFTLCTVTPNELTTTFVNDEGRIIYQHVRTKQP